MRAGHDPLRRAPEDFTRFGAHLLLSHLPRRRELPREREEVVEISPVEVGLDLAEQLDLEREKKRRAEAGAALGQGARRGRRGRRSETSPLHSLGQGTGPLPALEGATRGLEEEREGEEGPAP